MNNILNRLLVFAGVLFLVSCNNAEDFKSLSEKVSLDLFGGISQGSEWKKSTRAAVESNSSESAPQGKGVYVGLAMFDVRTETPDIIINSREMWEYAVPYPAWFAGLEDAESGKLSFRTWSDLSTPSAIFYNDEMTKFIRGFHPVIDDNGRKIVTDNQRYQQWDNFDGSQDIMVSDVVYGSYDENALTANHPAVMKFRHLCARFNFVFRVDGNYPEMGTDTAGAYSLEEIAVLYGNILDVQIIDHHSLVLLDLFDGTLRWSTAVETPHSYLSVLNNGYTVTGLPVEQGNTPGISVSKSFGYVMVEPGLYHYTLRIVGDGELLKFPPATHGYIDIPFVVREAPEAGKSYNVNVSFHKSFEVEIRCEMQDLHETDQDFN